MENNTIDLRLKLKQMSSTELAEMLRAETEKETPDDDLVLQLLHILEERDADKPVELSPESRTAWKKYQAKVRAREKNLKIHFGWIMKAAASFILIVGVMSMLIPRQANAGSFWKILTSVTDTLFEYVNIGADSTEPEEYVFETDNPGLQQVYDAVVEELEVTVPVVVKWLPEGNVLTELKHIETPAKNSIKAIFKNGDVETILIYNKMEIDLSPQYDKALGQVKEFELNGIVHSYMKNDHVWIANWVRQNVKCSIYIDCQEDVLKQIIKSIY